jgi:c-di-GMP-binding flagellar brake protein YcgR
MLLMHIAFLNPNWLTKSAAAILDTMASLRWGFVGAGVLAVALAFVCVYGRRLYLRRVAAALTKDLGGEIRATSSIRNNPWATLRPVDTPEAPVLSMEVLQMHRNAIVLRLVEGDERLLAPNQPVLVTIATATAAYQFYATILSVYLAEDICVRVTRPPWVAWVQRRRFFRVGVQLPTMLSVPASTSGADEFYCGIIRDISASGVRIGAPTRLKVSTKVAVRIPITDERGTLFSASVLACTRAPRSEPYPYVIQCAFVDLPADAQELLLRYCFDLQRNQMRAERPSDREAS